MSRSWRKLLVAVAATLVVAAAVGGVVHDRRASAWETRAAQAEQTADAAIARADSAAAREIVYQVRVDSLTRIAEDQGRRLRSRVDEVRAVVAPDTCAPFIAVRDTLIDDALRALGTWETAHAFQIVVNTELHVQVQALRLTADTLRSVLAARPKPRSKLLPGIGPFVGACPSGFCVGVGLTWRF